VTINVDSANLSSNVADSLIEITNIVPLETVDSIPETIISSPFWVKKIISLDTLILVFDQNFRNVSAYSHSGKYLRSIGSLGSGPGKSTFILDVVYNYLKNAIFIISNSPGKIMEFDLEGKLIREHKIDFYPSSMAFLQSGEYIFDINYNYNDVSGNNNVIVTDSLFNVISRCLPIIERKTKTLLPSNLMNGGIFGNKFSGTIYNPSYTTAIYEIKKNGLMPLYYVKFPGATDLKLGIPKLKHPEDSLNYELSGTIIKNERFVGANFSETNLQKFGRLFFDMENQKLFVSTNSAFSTTKGIPWPIFQSEQKLMMLVNLSEFLETTAMPPNITSSISKEKTNSRLAIVSFNLKNSL